MKSIATFILLSISLALSAQDIIVTKDSKRIDANITEVSDENIRYKKPTLPDGPVFVIAIKDINTIVYRNGDVQTFKEESAKTEQTQEKTEFITESPESTIKLSNEKIVRVKNTYIYGDKKMRGKEYENFLRNTCPEAYQRYRKGKETATAGWILLATGLATDISYIVTKGKGLGFIALGLEIACIPTLIVGYGRKHRSADVFNANCTTNEKSTAYWSINANNNGIGLSYNF